MFINLPRTEAREPEHQNSSEIVHILHQIEAEYIAAQHGLSGLAATAKHAVITARMEHLGQLHKNLQAIVGAEAMRLIAERLEHISTG